jgi:hypothetical protein
MKTTVRIEKEVDIKTVLVQVPVRYGTEDIPSDFPLRIGDVWTARIGVDDGIIDSWPQGQSGRLQMKVCDEGTYKLLDEKGEEIAAIYQDYVPNGLISGEYGDYIDLIIDENGRVTNWPKRPTFGAFFGDDD